MTHVEVVEEATQLADDCSAPRRPDEGAIDAQDTDFAGATTVQPKEATPGHQQWWAHSL